MNSTTKYQLSLPFVLLSASPPLAALHATRARTLLPAESAFLDSTHCLKCGSYFQDEAPSIQRYKLSNHEGYFRFKTRTCVACGFSHNIPIVHGNASLFPRTRKTRAPTPGTGAEPQILAAELP